MKRILVIDDLRVFDRLDGSVNYARTSEGALTLLRACASVSLHWDEIWWDHDLGGEDTTIPVLTLLEELAFEGTPLSIGKCVVHTANPVGARTLETVLARHYPTQRVDAADYSSGTLGG